jgi:hypothetical protein
VQSYSGVPEVLAATLLIESEFFMISLTAQGEMIQHTRHLMKWKDLKDEMTLNSKFLWAAACIKTVLNF